MAATVVCPASVASENSPNHATPDAAAVSSLADDFDFGSSDEVKVFKDEGEDEEKEFATQEELQAALSEDKSSLIQETELSIIKQEALRLHDHHAKGPDDSSPGSPFSNGYHQLLSPFSSTPGSSTYSLPDHAAIPPHSSTSVRAGSPSSAFLYSDPLGSPPPAHMGGIPYSLDPSKGLRPLYPLHPGSYPYSLLSPSEMPQFSPCSPLSRCGPGGSLLSPTSAGFSPHSQSIMSSSDGASASTLTSTSSTVAANRRAAREREREEKRTTHIKKPLNAFMLYMKEMRPKIVAECTLKESAAINQILGRRWHSLSREEQAKYYEQARKERQLHMQMYPGWSARDNYAQSKKKKRKREADTSTSNGRGQQKKCRARYGLEQQDRWCKPCNRIGGGSTSALDIMMGSSMSHQPQHYLDDGLGGLGPPLDPNMAALMHNSVNNNNNMVSPSSTSSLSPIHCGGNSDILSQNGLTPSSSSSSSAALAAAAAASIEAIGHFVDGHMMHGHPAMQKLEKSTPSNGGGDGSSPKYISL